MSMVRWFETVRHLSASQWAHRPLCRGMFVAMEALPGLSRRYFERSSKRIGPFDFASTRVSATTAHIVELQKAVHGAFLDGVPKGRFTLLNREVDFGRIEQVEWRRELGERNNRLWRMNLSYMGYLVPLVDRDGAAAIPLIASLLESLTEQNPWSCPGVFRDVWHPYSVSHRVINLVTCMALLARRGVAIEEGASRLIQAEIALGAAFLLKNLERDLQFNHLFKNFTCLAVVAAACSKRGSFAVRPLSEVGKSIAQQFLLDGGHAERCPMYHLLSIIDLRVLRDSEELSSRCAEIVHKTILASEKVTDAFVHPDGEVALFNDSWLSEAPSARDLVEVVNPTPKTFHRLEYPSVGYGRLAQGGDNVVLDYGFCGPDANPGHAHADFLSIELSVEGVRTIVDPGVRTYSEGSARDALRSAASHNGPCLIGAEPIEFWSSFRVGRRGYAYPLSLSPTIDNALAGWHSGYLHLGQRLGRGVQLFPGRGLLVVDLWLGASSLPEHTGFLVPQPWIANETDGFTIDDGQRSITLSISTLAGTRIQNKVSPYCLRFGVEQDGSLVSFAPEQMEDGSRRLVVWLSWAGCEGRQAPPETMPLVEAVGVAMAAVTRKQQPTRLIEWAVGGTCR